MSVNSGDGTRAIQAPPVTMSAMVLTGHGDLDMLEFHTHWPAPVAADQQVLIRVLACGLNNTDINTRTAWYSKMVTDGTTGSGFADADSEDAAWGGAAIQFPRIQGADVVGEVVTVGKSADPALIGKRVLVDTWLRDWDDPLNLDKTGYFGSECDGGFAQFTTVDQRQVHPINSRLSDAELATFATACITAENMLNRAQVTSEDVVLIPGASGGVGSALVQLARRRGARTVALASESKHADMQRLEPDVLLPRSLGDCRSVLKKYLNRDTVSVVADVVGGADWTAFIDVLERGGRYTCAGAIAGPMVNFDLRTFYLRDLTMLGATVVPPGVFANLVNYIEANEIQPMLAKRFDLADLKEAQQMFIAKGHIGNIVVVP